MLTKIIKRFNFVANKHAGQAIIHISPGMIRLLNLANDNAATGLTLVSISIENNQWQAALLTALNKLPKNCQLHLILAPDRYQIIQIDKPSLADNEMLQALPWLVKDLVEIPVDDMVVDYLELPAVTSQSNKINVVVCRLSYLKSVVELLHQHKKTVVTIQPEEWLLAGHSLQSSHSTMLVMHQPNQELLIQIVREGAVYFSRRARGFNRLSAASAAELGMDMLDNLLLELQRSMDYFESQLKQPPVRDIRLIIDNHADMLVELLKTNGYGRTEVLQFNQTPENMSNAELTPYWAVLALVPQIIAGASL